MATITIGSNTAEPLLYISTFYALVGQTIFFKFKLPKLLNNQLGIKNIKLITGENNLSLTQLNSLNLDFDPQTPNPDNVSYKFSNVGVYYISYEVTYVNNTVKTFFSDTPINIYKSWPVFKQEDIRILGENILTLPYTFEDIRINPNEFGVASVFNSSITKLHLNLEYLKSNTRILNSKTPSLYFGWLGVNGSLIADGLEWHTINYKSEFVETPSYAVPINTGFLNIKDLAETNDRLFVLDDRGLRIFINSNSPGEIKFSNMEDIISTTTNLVSFDVSEDGKLLYLLDSVQNKIFRVDIDYDSTNNSLYETYNPILSLTYNIGAFGSLEKPYGFNNPIQILHINKNVYILDYNNQAVKLYTENLEWIHTYYISGFEQNQPLSVAVQKQTNFAYIMTSSKVYVFNYKKNSASSIIDISSLTPLDPIKIFFDEAGEFFYILTKKAVFKYTATGLYMDVVNIPDSNLEYTNAKKTTGRNVILSVKDAIIKIQEITDIIETGEGLDVNYWALDQLKVYEEELVQDLTYNRCLLRMGQNIKNFRNSLEAKPQLVSEFTVAGQLNYFGLAPLKSNLRPKLQNDVERDMVAVGVNELHNLSIINRELQKLYDSLMILKKFLDIETVAVDSSLGQSLNKCNSLFCWSWKAMSTYKISKPMIRTCNINPISFAELRSKFPSLYTSSKSWVDASSPCCSKQKTPLK
jgi:hypothetical protein